MDRISEKIKAEVSAFVLTKNDPSNLTDEREASNAMKER